MKQSGSKIKKNFALLEIMTVVAFLLFLATWGIAAHSLVSVGEFQYEMVRYATVLLSILFGACCYKSCCEYRADLEYKAKIECEQMRHDR